VTKNAMNTQGHFRILRKIYDTDLFKNIVDFRLFFLILGQSMFKEGIEIGGTKLERGEWLRSYRQLQKDLEYIDGRAVRQYGLSTLKRSTDRLKAEQLICTRQAESGTVFKIAEYDEWQGITNIEKAKAERIAEREKAESETRRTNVLTRTNDIQEINIPTNLPHAHARRVSFYDQFFMAYGRQPTPIQIGQLNAYIDQEGIDEELLMLAINKAAQVSGHFEYLKGILNNWATKGIKTINQAQIETKQRREAREQRQTASEKSKYENIGTDW
jgi:DnaD/phage-associated family protein